MITRCPSCGQQARQAECDDGEIRLLELQECGHGRYALWSQNGTKLPHQDVLAGRGHFTHTCPQAPGART